MKEFIINIVKEAGQISLDYLGKSKISLKGPKNVVTEADIVVENHIKSRIREKYPEHNIVAEESDNKKTDSNYTWYIDPIDGTTNYSHNDPHFCISIALAKNNGLKYACVFIPMLNELYYAEKGKGAELNGKPIKVSSNDMQNAFFQTGISPYEDAIDDSLKLHRHFMVKGLRARDYGFCAGQLAFVAMGRAECLIKKSQHSWDIAAGILLVEEAGGKVTDFKGDNIEINKERNDVVASNNIIHDKVLDELNKIKFGDKTWFP